MRQNKSSAIEIELRSRLEKGRWKPGTLIPDERRLAEKFSVARNTVRKAIGKLETEGLLDRQVGRGTVVREPLDDASKSILHHFEVASPSDILNLRIFLEPMSAGMAARKVSDADLARIREAARQADQVTDLNSYEFWDVEFHRRITEASQNRFLIDMFNFLTVFRYAPPMMEIRRQRFSEEHRQSYNHEHSEILSALADWDSARATKAMRNHLISRRINYFGQ